MRQPLLFPHRRKSRQLCAAALIAAALVLAACGGGAGGGHPIWTATTHTALAADQLKILTKTPPTYERLGTVTHLYTESPWQDGGDATAIMQDLLKEAAAMGANVLLLVDDTTMADSAATMKYQGQIYTFPVIAKTKTIVAQGIFVPKE